MSRLRAAGKCTNFCWNANCLDVATLDGDGSITSQVGMEVHIDDVRGFGPDPQVEKFEEDLAVHIRFRDGGVHHDGSEYDHLKRFRKKFNGVTTMESNPKYLDAVLDLLGLESAMDVPTPSVPAHKEQLMTGEFLESAARSQCTECVGGLLYYTEDWADAQYEVSIIGSMLGKPTRGSMISLKRVLVT